MECQLKLTKYVLAMPRAEITGHEPITNSTLSRSCVHPDPHPDRILPAMTLPLYEMSIEFQSEENRANDTAQGRTFLFAHPEQSTASRKAGEQPLLDAAFRFWRNRHAAWPEHFHRLCCVKIYVITPQEIDANGSLPPNRSMFCIEWKYDWPMVNQPCPDNLNPKRIPEP
jgi:hypothetical protein